MDRYYNLYILHQCLEIVSMEEKNDIDKVLKDNLYCLHIEINKEILDEINKEEVNEANKMINQEEIFDYEKFKEGLKYLYIYLCIVCKIEG